MFSELAGFQDGNLFNLFHAQRTEDQNFVDAIQEFGRMVSLSDRKTLSLTRSYSASAFLAGIIG